MNEKLSQFNTPESGVEQFQSTKMWDEINKTREEALESTIAGLHFPETKQTTTTYQAMNQENPYEIQREALSKLSLLDENLNPTDTYTNYINQGNTPIPGMESSHETLLFLDRQQEKMNQQQQGLITEDQMLLDLYGRDILEYNGYNVMSVGWWQNKFHNNDFTSPFDNQYLMYQVKEQARNHHNQLLAKKYSQDAKVSNSHLSTLLNKGDLSNQDIKTLFPELAEAINETEDSTDYQRFITSGQISAQLRIHTTQTGDRYYLHTDGELYLLSNDGGANTARYKEDENGNITEISLNSGDLADYAHSFKAGAASIVSNTAKLIWGLYGATFGYAIQGLTEGDWDWVDSITDSTNWLDSQFNDNLSAVFDSRYVDLDGFKINDGKDWGMFLSQTTGAVLFGAWSGGKAASLAQWASKFNTRSGKILTQALNLYARSTGNYKGYVPKESTVSLGAWALNSAHLQTVETYFLKDFISNIQTLNNQKTELALNEYLKDPDAYDPSKWDNKSWSIFGHSLSNAALNGFISMAFAGGIDDNQAARWAELLEKKNKLGPINLSALGKSLQKHKLAFNTTTDFLDNILTMYSSAIMGYNEDTGSIEWNRNMSTYDENGEYTGFNTALFVRTAAQAAIQTAPTLMSNLQSRNIMGENILAVGDAWVKKLNDLEAKAANQEAKKLAQTVRIDYLNDIKNCKEVELSTGEKVAPSPEQRVAYALDRAQSRLKTEAIPNLIDDICNPITLKVYKDAIDLSIEQYNKTLKRHTEMETEIKKKGIKAIKEYFSNGIKNNFSNHIAVEKYKESIKNIDYFVDKMYDSYLTLTDSKESATTQERLIARINLTSEMLEEVEETHMTYRSLVKGRKELKDKVLNAAAEYANRVGLDSAESVIGASKFYRFKNESEDRDTLNIERAAMELMSEAVPYAVYKIDENTYGMVAMDKEITNLFHTDTAAKFSLAMHALGKGTAEDKQAAIDLIITTLIGDQAVKNFKRGKYNKAATKETVEAILNTAIKNKVINKKQAAELLINLTETDSEIGKSLSTVFETNVSTKNVNNLKNLSELEKYTLIYESINHLKNPETKRFSGKTVAAEALLQQKYDAVVLEVLDDLKGQLPEALKSYYIKAKGEDLFPLATDSIMRHLTNVIGEKGLVNFKESDVETYLRSLGTNASEPALQQAAKDLMECINTLKNFKSIQFDGNSVTLDLSAWSHKQYRNMVNEILRTDVSSRKSREEKDNSYKGMSEYAAQRTLDVNKKYKGSNITIELKDSNMDAITELYNLLVDGGFIDDEFSVKPKTAEDMKKILSRDLSDEGRIFAKYKNNTEFNTNIISDKDAKIIQDKLKTFSTEEIIDTVTVIDPRKGSQIRYDYYTILGSNIQINKISKKMDSLMRRNKNMPIYINPVDINTLGTEKNGAPMYITYDEGYTSKRGRISKEGGSIQRVVNSHAEAAMVNKDLALTTMIDSYIDYIVKNPEQIKIVIPSKYYSDLKGLGIIDSEDSFYVSKEMYSTIEDPNADVSYMQLTLKDGVTKLDMEYYLLHDEDPNLFKVLPFVSDDKLNSDIPFIAPEGHKLSFIPDITGGLTTDYTGLYSIMNMNFDYDQKGILKQNLFEDLFSNAENTNFIFNPFSEMRKPINKNSLEEYIEYRNSGELEDGINDPYYELVKSYININEKYIAGDNEENDDYKIWLQNGNVLKKIIKAVENKQKISEAFITDIINTYKDTTDFDNIVGYRDSGYYYNNISTDSRISTASNMNSDTAMSKNILDASIGIDYQLVDVDGKAYDGAEVDIKKAFKYVQDNIEALKGIQDITTSPYIGSEDYILYRPTSSSELWAILSASEGRITIEDLDRLRRLEADAYNEFFEKLSMSYCRLISH